MQKLDTESQIHHKEGSKLICQPNGNREKQFIYSFSFTEVCCSLGMNVTGTSNVDICRLARTL